MIKLVWWKTSNQNFLKLPHNKKKITHMWRRWSTPQNFLLRFIDELWKAWKIRVLKKNEKKKLLEISSFYTCVPKTIIIWGTVPVIQSEANFGHFLPFTSPPPPQQQQQQQPRKPKFWRNEKSIRRSHNFKLVQQKAQSNYVCLLRYGLQQTFFCHFRLFFFLLFYPAIDPRN